MIEKSWLHGLGLSIVRIGCGRIQSHSQIVRFMNWLNFKNKVTNHPIMPDYLLLWIAWWFNSLKEKSWWLHFGFADVRNVVGHSDSRIFMLAATYVLFEKMVTGSITTTSINQKCQLRLLVLPSIYFKL